MTRNERIVNVVTPLPRHKRPDKQAETNVFFINYNTTFSHVLKCRGMTVNSLYFDGKLMFKF